MCLLRISHRNPSGISRGDLMTEDRKIGLGEMSTSRMNDTRGLRSKKDRKHSDLDASGGGDDQRESVQSYQRSGSTKNRTFRGNESQTELIDKFKTVNSLFF